MNFFKFVLYLTQLTLEIVSVLGQVPFIDYKQFLNQSVESLGGFLSVRRSDISFRLFTRANPTAYIPLNITQLSNIVTQRRTKLFKVITHGYIDSANSTWMLKMKDAYLQKDDYNVVLVDWASPSRAFYPLAARYTKDIGFYLGQLVYNFNRNLSIPYASFHLIGHSLGAHISGFAGQFIQQYVNTTLPRISGLDPAGPLFFLNSATNRLNSNDATFVDVIHTDSFMYGYILPLGDIDFYPNGGVAPQPGCNALDAMSEIIYGCSHIRSHDLFIESINSNAFIATECQNIIMYMFRMCSMNKNVPMGENVNQSMKGVFQLTTNSQSPFAKNGAI